MDDSQDPGPAERPETPQTSEASEVAGSSGPPAPVPSVEEVAAELEEAAPRRYPSTIGGAFYIVVLAATVIGVVVVTTTGNWRVGVRWIAGALIGAATVRTVLPHRDAGMLAVRHRLLDCLMLGGVGGALLFLAATIPDQPV